MFGAISFVALFVMSTLADAEDTYPSKPVRIIVPVTAGGGVDNIARILAVHLRDALGQTFYVENKPGAGTTIGLDQLAKAPPDGYTIAIVPNSMTINHSLMNNLPYDTFKSFSPVILIGALPPAIVAGRAGLPPKNLQELVQYAKAHPGLLSYAGCDTGSALHLAGELLKQQAGIELTHIPYKGCADTIPNVLGGQVDLIFITLPNVVDYLKDGRLQLYAVAAKQRSHFAPDFPTGAEQGYPGFVVDAWYGMLAPAGTPDAIVGKLNQTMNMILKKPEVRTAFAVSFTDPLGGTPKNFADTIRADVANYGSVISQAKIHLN
jgi:tripartite-type tricarboxylate transporter receptor subunit TctC